MLRRAVAEITKKKNRSMLTFHVKIYINNIFFIFKKLFLTLVYQNNLKTLKTY